MLRGRAAWDGVAPDGVRVGDQVSEHNGPFPNGSTPFPADHDRPVAKCGECPARSIWGRIFDEVEQKNDRPPPCL